MRARTSVQTYTITKVDHRNNKSTVIGTNILVPPNNEGDATPFYNQGNVGDNMAKPAVTSSALLDSLYTRRRFTPIRSVISRSAASAMTAFTRMSSPFSICSNCAVLARIRKRAYNIHEMVLRIPMSELGGDQQTVGVYATTSRRPCPFCAMAPLTQARN